MKKKEENISNLISSSSSELRNEITKIKTDCTKELQFMNQSHELLNTAVTKMVVLTYERQRRIDSMTNDNKILNESLSSMKKMHKEYVKQNQNDLENSKNKITKLKAFLASSDVAKINLTKENLTLKDDALAELSKKENLIAELSRLKLKISKIEVECQESVALARTNELTCRLECEEVSSNNNLTNIM